MVCTVSSKGQVVIPAQIRKRYHLKARTKIEFFDTGHSIMIVPKIDKEKAFKQSFGMLKGLMTVEDFLQERRQERRRENEHYAKKFGIHP